MKILKATSDIWRASLPREDSGSGLLQGRRSPLLVAWPVGGARTHALSSRAFSLVEIVIAVGLTVFAVLSIVGLLAVGLGSYR